MSDPRNRDPFHVPVTPLAGGRAAGARARVAALVGLGLIAGAIGLALASRTAGPQRITGPSVPAVVRGDRPSTPPTAVALDPAIGPAPRPSAPASSACSTSAISRSRARRPSTSSFVRGPMSRWSAGSRAVDGTAC
ncbi:MAG: hypothetical protein QOF49_1059 [Chloroflexota bacterium]|nr:hypothetical protein [Chloroflexota bacterium]